MFCEIERKTEKENANQSWITLSKMKYRYGNVQFGKNVSKRKGKYEFIHIGDFVLSKTDSTKNKNKIK